MLDGENKNKEKDNRTVLDIREILDQMGISYDKIPDDVLEKNGNTNSSFSRPSQRL